MLPDRPGSEVSPITTTQVMLLDKQTVQNPNRMLLKAFHREIEVQWAITWRVPRIIHLFPDLFRGRVATETAKVLGQAVFFLDRQMFDRKR